MKEDIFYSNLTVSIWYIINHFSCFYFIFQCYFFGITYIIRKDTDNHYVNNDVIFLLNNINHYKTDSWTHSISS